MSYSFDDDKLKEAVKKVDEYYINSLPRNDDIEYQFSKRFQRRMKKLIKQSMKKENSVRTTFINKRIAVVFLSIFILLASSMNVSAVRRAVFEFISYVYEKYTEIIFDNSKPITKGEFTPFTPSYIPEGFTINLEDLDGSVYLEYIKSDDYIIYEQKNKEDVTSHINTEGIEVEDTEINGQPAIYYSNYGVQNLIWHDELYMYSIFSTLNKEEVFRIAMSIQ
ncbi:DUF4367 domain-containing protein [Anaerocolumna aminovalerica]|uniref:DUF4367 domain-containing protein n=1 Tax=Anaerocolumna aminovalerica TaxID=1527 RepID=UPI001C0EC59F|nr:DUF4367 domain-containing protein [Anaerocolumna aminovalerica]MBU5334392.1 DUF4367 domain-containing protein [Anaerocolumna aminovalerica]